LGERVLIGVTSDRFAQALKPERQLVRSYPERVRQLRAFLRRGYPKRRYVIRQLNDFFGPGVFTAQIEAMVVSPETKARIPLANQLRRASGLPPLKYHVIRWVRGENGRPISSTRIRRGEIDVEGRRVRARRT
jgi:pantetheine-phosphate adenylyltransferase